MFFPKNIISAIITLAVATSTQAGIKGAIVDESDTPIQNAVITTRDLPSLLSNARTLTNEKGEFDFDKAKLNAASKKSLRKRGQSLIAHKT